MSPFFHGQLALSADPGGVRLVAVGEGGIDPFAIVAVLLQEGLSTLTIFYAALITQSDRSVGQNQYGIKSVPYSLIG